MRRYKPSSFISSVCVPDWTIRPFSSTMIWLILANVVVAATDVALPMFSQYAINELVLNQGNDDQIVWFAFAYLITVAVQCLSI